jgi:hypothetical protein
MQPESAGRDEEYDLDAASRNLYPYTLRRRRVALVGVAFMLVLGLVVVALQAPAIANRSISGYDLLGFILLVGMVATWVPIALSFAFKLRKGAVRLRVNGQGFDLTYPDGAHSRIAWSDPKLEFELMDASEVNPARLLAQPPYSVSIGGVRSLLTKEAYDGMLRAVGDHGLSDITERGSRWIYPADANPRNHRIRPMTRDPRPAMGRGRAGT